MSGTKPAKLDLRKELKHLYNPSTKEVSVVDVPEMAFLMVDGEGNPDTAEAFQQAVEALFSLSYAIKFMVKKGDLGIDYAVMPLEGLWWTDDMREFSTENKDSWHWTVMVMQPEFVTSAIVDEAKDQVQRKKGPLPGLDALRFEDFREGPAVQIMHIGPFADEGPKIAMLHRYIEEQGHQLSGKHHEIYLSDIRRTAPERLRTVIRQPFE